MSVLVQLVITVEDVVPKVTPPTPCVAPKLVPVIVTLDPTGPLVGVKELIVGNVVCDEIDFDR